MKHKLKLIKNLKKYKNTDYNKAIEDVLEILTGKVDKKGGFGPL